MTELFYSLIIWLESALGWIAGAGALAIGIAIVCLKDRAPKMLGAWLGLSGIDIIIFKFGDMMKSVSVEAYAGTSIPFQFITLILSYLIIVSLFMYAKQRYDAKGLIAILAIKFGGGLLYRIIVIWGSKRLMNTQAEAMAPFMYTLHIFDILIVIAYSVILLVIYYRNREHDWMFPKLWIFLLMFICVNVLEAFIYLGAIFTVSVGDGWTMLPKMLLSIVRNSVWIAAGVYLLKRIAASKKETEAVPAD